MICILVCVYERYLICVCDMCERYNEAVQHVERERERRERQREREKREGEGF